MPKFAHSRSQPIKDKQKRQVAYCRLKKELIKRAMEFSQMCANQVLVVVYDEERERMVYYSSETDFTLMAAHLAKKKAKDPKNIHKFERFTNENYESMCS